MVIDSNRPRHAATLISHGFLTRDGISPLELRRLGREEFLEYPDANFRFGVVSALTPLTDSESIQPESSDDSILGPIQSDAEETSHKHSRLEGKELTGLYGWKIESKGFNGHPDLSVRARSVLLATGLREEFPEFPSLRNFYGMSVFSCIECDGYELSDRTLGLFGTTSDLAKRALLLSQFSKDLTVFTLASDAITNLQEDLLEGRGITVNHEPVADLVGTHNLEGVQLESGEVIPITGGIIRPRWHQQLDFLGDVSTEVDDWGLLKVDRDGRTTLPYLYAAGDITSPGPQQLVVAAGSGAKAAATISRDLITL